MAEECLFCQIGAGAIPSDKVYEDETTLAFRDINPMMPVHILVIPKDHYASLSDNVPEAVLGHLMAVAAQVAAEAGVDQSGYRIMINTGDDACQTVHHIHVHVLGGAPMNEGSPAR